MAFGKINQTLIDVRFLSNLYIGSFMPLSPLSDFYTQLILSSYLKVPYIATASSTVISPFPTWNAAPRI